MRINPAGGDATPRSFKAVALIVPAVVAVLTLGGVVGALMIRQQGRIADARAWLPAGPPCEIASQAAYTALASSQPRAIMLDGVQFVRSSGQATCGEAPNLSGRGPRTIPVCQFSDPTALAVTIGADTRYYLPRSAPATVSVADGQPHCVLAAGHAGD